jgi:hypothetical protein
MILVMDLPPHHHAVSVPSPLFCFSTTAALLSDTLQTNHSATQSDRQWGTEIRPACAAARLPSLLPLLPSFVTFVSGCPSTILSVVLCPPSTGTRAQLSLRVRPLFSSSLSLSLPFFSILFLFAASARSLFQQSLCSTGACFIGVSFMKRNYCFVLSQG